MRVSNLSHLFSQQLPILFLLVILGLGIYARVKTAG